MEQFLAVATWRGIKVIGGNFGMSLAVQLESAEIPTSYRSARGEKCVVRRDTAPPPGELTNLIGKVGRGKRQPINQRRQEGDLVRIGTMGSDAGRRNRTCRS